MEGFLISPNYLASSYSMVPSTTFQALYPMQHVNSKFAGCNPIHSDAPNHTHTVLSIAMCSIASKETVPTIQQLRLHFGCTNMKSKTRIMTQAMLWWAWQLSWLWLL